MEEQAAAGYCEGRRTLTLLKNYRRRLLTVRLDQSACNEFTELFLLLHREQTICWKCVASLFSFATRVDVDDEVQPAQAAFDEAYGLSIWEDLLVRLKWVANPGMPSTLATPATPVPTPIVAPTPAVHQWSLREHRRQISSKASGIG